MYSVVVYGLVELRAVAAYDVRWEAADYLRQDELVDPVHQALAARRQGPLRDLGVPQTVVLRLRVGLLHTERVLLALALGKALVLLLNLG